MSCFILYDSTDAYQKQVEDAKKWRELEKRIEKGVATTFNEEDFYKYEKNGGDMVIPHEVFWDFYYEYEDLTSENHDLMVENSVLKGQIAGLCQPKYDYGISMSSSEGGDEE